MQESVIYQEIKAEGIQEGLQQGIQEGLQQGIQEGLQKERQLVLRLLSRKVGDIPENFRVQVEELPLLQLELLGEALLDFERLNDLINWLAEHVDSQEGCDTETA